ncbi:MAG: sigma-70 family RNA polymerase sigma factor [Exilibacterium sp.]
MEVSDQELIRRVTKGGDRHAYSQLVRRYQSPLRYSLQRWCHGDFSLAEDLAQEAFIKAYQALPGFRREARFSTWLYKIAYNVMLSHQRKKRLDTLCSEEEVERASVSSVEKTSNQVTGMEGVDANRDVAAALAQLSDGQQQAIHLCLQRGFSHQETAEIMNIPLGSVKTHVLRGKKKLQALLKSWQNGVVND